MVSVCHAQHLYGVQDLISGKNYIHRGRIGIAGAKGDVGEKGESGMKGPQGPRGVKGEPVSSGLKIASKSEFR